MTSGHYWKLDEAKHLLTFLFHGVKNKYVKIKNWFKLSEQTLNWISLILLIYILILMFFCLMINSMIMLSQHIVRQKLYKKYILNIIHICSTTENLPVHVLGCSFGVLYFLSWRITLCTYILNILINHQWLYWDREMLFIVKHSKTSVNVKNEHNVLH